VKKTLTEFLAEKKKAGIDHDVETKFKDVDCNCDLDTLDIEARNYCNAKRMIDLINKSYTVND